MLAERQQMFQDEIKTSEHFFFSKCLHLITSHYVLYSNGFPCDFVRLATKTTKHLIEKKQVRASNQKSNDLMHIQEANVEGY